MRTDRLDRRAGAGLLIVEFQDTGIGIAPEYLERIFDPFQQGSEAQRGREKGLGLGLAISREVAELHGGRLTAASPGPGQGATFRLELLTTAPRQRASQPIPLVEYGSAPRTSGVRILLMEDNFDIRRYLELTLRGQGWEVQSVSSLEAARQAVAETDFDLLISDIEFPDGSGLELMRHVESAQASRESR